MENSVARNFSLEIFKIEMKRNQSYQWNTHRMNLMNLRVKIEIVLQVNCSDARMKMTF